MRHWPIVIIIWAACTAAAPVLPRGITLGIAAESGDANHPGRVTVAQVSPASTAADIGVRAGDTILAVNGSATRSADDLVAAARSLKAGDRLTLAVLRNGKRLALAGRARGRPLESYAGATTRYGAVPFHGGLLRDILVRPTKPAPGAPVVFLIQGFSCASVESADPMHPYRQLVSGLAARGVAVYRIEKPGMGDSRGPDLCSEDRLETELGAFEAGYRALQDRHGYVPRQLFLFGHSLGGMEAPFIAARQATPAGIAVYGIALKNWYDYVLDVVRVQDVLSGTADPVERNAAAEAARGPLRSLYLEGRSPAEVAAADPKAAEMLRLTHEWDGGDHLFGRHYRFLQDLARMKQVEAWKASRTPVLALYGESDLIAISGEDARYLATIVNHYRPGSGQFAELEGLEHGMTLVGSRDEYARAVQSGRFKPMTGRLGPELVNRLADWIAGLAPGAEASAPR